METTAIQRPSEEDNRHKVVVATELERKLLEAVAEEEQGLAKRWTDSDFEDMTRRHVKRMEALRMS